MVENFHQLLAVLPWRIIIEQVQLRDTLAIEITEHDPRLLIPVPIDPYRIQTLYRSIDDIPAILRWRQQLNGSAVTVVFFVQRKRRCLHERRYVSAVLMLPTKFLCASGRIWTDSLAHLFIGGNALPKRPAADDFLFHWSKLFQLKTRFAAKLTDGSLKYHVEVFADKADIRISQLQDGFYPHRLKLFADTAANTPHFIHRK